MHERRIGMSEELEIAVRGEDDSAALAALHAACFEPSWTADAFTELLAMPGCFALVAEIAGAADGEVTAAGLILARLAGDECEVITVGVTPDHRRRGLATLLVEHAAVRAAALGAARQVLEVGVGNAAARRLYSRLGFAECGTRPGYYGGAEGGDAVILARDLGPDPDETASANKVN